ncbi:hypothetical protein LXA43DRAFT_1014008 [Ganoderma leucocontextum]|nr:hypothetical protein LXA43DRAFT_1014008 [Ganoderma leucocontextum]
MSNGDESQPNDEQTAGSTVQLQGRNLSPSNQAQFINSVPPEIFVQILEDVYLLLQRAGINWDTNWTIPYQLVCRRWRDVICSTPQFWKEISVNSSPRWLEFCFTRCGGALATVHVWHPTSPDATFATLCRHASAIRACYVHCDVAYMWYLSGLPSLLATPMPALETLSLNGPYHEDEILDVPITHDLVPRLASLFLLNCTAPRDTALYTSLRSLTLFGTSWTISYGEFLDIISKCGVLEHLSLDEKILDQFAEELADLPAGHRPRMPTPVVLPRLKVLQLHGQRQTLFHLLAIMHAPQATKIDLTNCLDDDEPGPLITRVLAPNPQLRYPFLSSPRAVSLSCWDGDPFNLCLQCGSDRDALFCVDYGMVHNEFWPGNAYLAHNLVAIMDLFSVASVDTLEVEGCPDQVAVGTWLRVFATFSNLHTLHIKGRGTLDSLWLGLSRATTSSLERGGAVCCPLLSEIAIDDRSWVASRFKFAATTALFDVVRGVLRTRADAGGTRLKKLQLHLEYTDELLSQTSELRDTFVQDVKALVEELDYRDWGT